MTRKRRGHLQAAADEVLRQLGAVVDAEIGRVKAELEICDFCGAPSRKKQEVQGNPEQVVRSCKAPECLAKFRGLVGDNGTRRDGSTIPWYANNHGAQKRRRRRRPRQVTRET